MKKLWFTLMALLAVLTITAQVKKTTQGSKLVATPNKTVEIYDLIKKLWMDSTGYSEVGDWAVGNPKKFPVKWNEDRIIMSEDTSINFYRLGSANVTVGGKSFLHDGKPVAWNVMIKGPRMGYTSLSIISSPSKDFTTLTFIDSLFAGKSFKAELLKSCTNKKNMGFYYYKLKLPKKDFIYLKLSWITVNGITALSIDGYLDWTNYAAKLDCK